MKNKKKSNIKHTTSNKKGNGNMKIIVKDNTKRNKRFEYLCGMSQKALKKALVKELKDKKRNVIVGEGYIYSDGKLPILLCAHMDTVHKELPKEIIYKDGTISSPQGIGGDDRCGVYMIMEIIKELDCKIAFFEDEEIGGVGSDLFSCSDTIKELDGKINYVIELDRKGKTDSVYYELDNYDFEKFINKEYFKTQYGSFTDICNICPELGVAGVNLSCGYYKQHTVEEYVDLKEMETIIKEVKKLIERSDDTVFEYKERVSYWNKWKSSVYTWSDGWGDTKQYSQDEYYVMYVNGSVEEMEYVFADSELEAVGTFLMNNPTLTYNHIIEIGYADDLDMNYASYYKQNK